MAENNRGKFIVFEGVEGSGKSTQIAAIARALRQSGRDVLATLEPGGTWVGTEIRSILLNFERPENHPDIQPWAELFLFAAARVQIVDTVIRPALNSGCLVLCDRFTDSTMAYQGYGRGIDRKVVQQVNDLASAGVKPDIVIWLDIDVEIGLRRAKNYTSPDRIERLDLEFHQRVNAGYRAIAESSDRVFRVDASQSEDLVTREIMTILSGS
jgi:dTMP kinase